MRYPISKKYLENIQWTEYSLFLAKSKGEDEGNRLLMVSDQWGNSFNQECCL